MSNLEQYAGCDGILDVDIKFHKLCYTLGIDTTKVTNWESMLNRFYQSNRALSAIK